MKEWRRKQPQKSKKGCCLEENKGTNLYLPKGESQNNTRVGRRYRLGTNFSDNIATRKKEISLYTHHFTHQSQTIDLTDCFEWFFVFG